MGVFRNVNILDRTVLQLCLEGTNLFNMVSLSSNTTLTSSLFGKIQSASSMRQILLGARITF